MIATGNADERLWHTYRCVVCGRTTPHAPSPPLAICKSVNRKNTQTICDKLGNPVTVIKRDILDCRAGDLTVYECNRYGELITLKGIPRDHVYIVRDSARSATHTYCERSCDTCQYPASRNVKLLIPIGRFTVDDVTIMTTTFKRPKAIERLLASLEKHYPGVPRIVVHTDGNLSAGRNRAVNSVKTRLTLVADDDFEFTNDTSIERWLDVLNHDADNEADLAGVSGSVVESNRSYSWCHTIKVFRGKMSIHPSTEDWRATKSGVMYRPCDMAINFFLARTEVLRETKWDENLPLEEHRDWFLRIYNLRKWRWGWVPSVTCLHHRDRNQEYTKFRNRSFLGKAQKKHGLTFVKPTLNNMALMHTNGTTSAHQIGKPLHPAAIVLGVGHSNTTITTKQLEMLGFNLHDADDEFAESVTVRSLNDVAMKTGKLDVSEASRLLSGWRRPWALKDPRFAKGTLPLWMCVLVEYKPILFWIDKPLNEVAASFERRGESSGGVRKFYDNCVEYFMWWPWAKCHITTEQVNNACAMFNPERSSGLTPLSE